MLLAGEVGNQSDVFLMHVFSEAWRAPRAELGWPDGHGGLGHPGADGAARLPQGQRVWTCDFSGLPNQTRGFALKEFQLFFFFKVFFAFCFPQAVSQKHRR